MSNQFVSLPLDIFEIIFNFLEGHAIHKLLLCGSRRLSVNINITVRRFRLWLSHVEKFPFYAFNFASPTEICVELDHNITHYPVARGGRDLLPLKPIPSLKKLHLAFFQSSSILDHGQRLAEVFPGLTDLSLKRAHSPITAAHFNALPSTLRRLQLFSTSIRPNEPITLKILRKVSKYGDAAINEFPHSALGR
jgi:hypothetical protein